jgi:cell division control protein 24
VIIVSAIMNEFPEEVFSEPPSSPQTAAAPSASSDALPHNDSSTTLVTLSGKERDRRNILREMLDTERKYVQDLEVMQVCVQASVLV